MKSFLISLFSVILVLTPFSTAYAEYENSSSSDASKLESKVVLLQEDKNKPIYLFESIDDQDILTELPDNTEAILLPDEKEQEKIGFMFIEIVLDNVIFQGFVEDKFLHTVEEAELILNERENYFELSEDELVEIDGETVGETEEKKQEKLERINDIEILNENKEELEVVTIKTKPASSETMIEEKSQATTSLLGFALKEPVAVYEKTNLDSRILKTYKFGSQLRYHNYSKDWYVATVHIQGEKHTGYIHKFDVGVANDSTAVFGEALKNKTSVYSNQSKNSRILKSYNKGHVLKYKVHNKDWLSATVIKNGKAIQGFIHINDVETGKSTSKMLSGYGIKSPTKVYRTAATNSGTLKSYRYGSNLKYQEFTSNWYEATVYLDGKATKGFISKKDIGKATQSLTGYALKSSTTVYSSKSKSSKALKNYTIGSTLQYRLHDNNWFEATVIINGKKQKGYIHHSDVGPNRPTISGFATKKSSRVYANTSRSSRILKSYAIGSNIKYKRYNNNWYTASVVVNGKRQTGYFHKNDVSTSAPQIKGYAAKNPTRAYTNTNRNSKVIKSYKKAANLKVRSYNSSWYQATVYVKGKAQRGYIHKNDFTTKKLSKVDKLTTIDNNNQLILVTSKGYNTTRVNIETYERGKDGLWNRKLSTRGYIGINGFAKNKREGDGKSPTGKYTIGNAFAQHPNPGTKLNFRRITSDDVWVDDPKSSLYNTWQKRSKTQHLWNSAESMNHRLYKYGFVINYNTKREPYRGSAIFFHIGNSYTVGCTATSQANVISMLKWLDPNKKPVIIQTPENELNRY